MVNVLSLTSELKLIVYTGTSDKIFNLTNEQYRWRLDVGIKASLSDRICLRAVVIVGYKWMEIFLLAKSPGMTSIII